MRYSYAYVQSSTFAEADVADGGQVWIVTDAWAGAGSEPSPLAGGSVIARCFSEVLAKRISDALNAF